MSQEMVGCVGLLRDVGVYKRTIFFLIERFLGKVGAPGEKKLKRIFGLRGRRN